MLAENSNEYEHLGILLVIVDLYFNMFMAEKPPSWHLKQQIKSILEYSQILPNFQQN